MAQITYKENHILATICARGGSKGVKNKNIRLLAGKPLIQYSLELVKQSQLIDEYIVSTDSEAIMDIVKKSGYEIRFKRPDELAGDKVSRIEPIRHAVKWVEHNLQKKFDIIIDFGVATPLKNVEDVDNSLKLLVDSGASNILSVTPCHRNPYFNMVEQIEGKVTKVKQLPQRINDRQSAPQVFDMNDAFNVWRYDVLFSDQPQFNANTKIFIMPRERSIDIDEEMDFTIAEALVKRGK